MLGPIGKKYQARAENILAQGSTGTNSRRPDQYVKGVYPTHFMRASGCNVWDPDGNKYIDFIGGLGSVILGYNDVRVNEAVRSQIASGLVTGSMPSYLEVEVGEMMADMFNVDRVRFLKTGSEACSAAVRIARAKSNRDIVISEGYHGHHDIFTSMTEPAIGVKDSFKIIHQRQKRITSSSVAAYITEPITLHDTDANRRTMKEKMDDFQRDGVMVIFDEVITGCRVPQGSVGKYWDVWPDISVFGKAIANGYPLAVVGGKQEVMNCGEYFISSTFSSEAVSLAACRATLQELQKLSIQDLCFYAKRFQEQFNNICGGIGVFIEGYGTRGMMNLTNYNTALFCQEACKAGLLFGKAFFYTFAHMEADFEEVVFNIITDIVRRIELGDCSLEGQLPVETFKR